MHLAVLGTGSVGRTLASAWLRAGHEVALGSRDAANAAARDWVAAAGGRARCGTFADAVEGADAVVNATAGTASLEVLASCPAAALDGTTVLDVANPLDFSAGFPPRLAVGDDDSLAERLQRAHPAARVVKALNTMAVEVMVDPAAVPGDHLALLCGDHEDAKSVVVGLLGDLGWPPTRIMDLGPLHAARGMERWLPLWLSLYGHLGHPMFNLALPQAPVPSLRG